jgi:hypothetical protein
VPLRMASRESATVRESLAKPGMPEARSRATDKIDVPRCSLISVGSSFVAGWSSLIRAAPPTDGTAPQPLFAYPLHFSCESPYTQVGLNEKPGPTRSPSFSSGILFAQAAKPSAKRIHLTPSVFLPAHRFGRDEPVFSFLIPCNRPQNSASFLLDARSLFRLAFLIHQSITYAACSKFRKAWDSQSVGDMRNCELCVCRSRTTNCPLRPPMLLAIRGPLEGDGQETESTDFRWRTPINEAAMAVRF